MQKYNNVCDVMHMKLFHLNDIYCFNFYEFLRREET